MHPWLYTNFCPPAVRFRPRVPALTSGAKRQRAPEGARGRQRAPEGAGPKGPRTPTAISKGTQHWHAWCAMCLPPMPIELYKIAHHVDESFVNFENARLFWQKSQAKTQFSTWPQRPFDQVENRISAPRQGAVHVFQRRPFASPGHVRPGRTPFFVEALGKTPFSTSNTVRHL